MMKHILPELPYNLNALAPHISAETLEFHWGKHHRTYVDKLNQLIQGTEFEEMKLDEIVRKSSGPIFNNGAQVWNHTFYWNSLTPNPRKPAEKMLESLQLSFGTLDAFLEKFHTTALGVFGSGWTWLVYHEKEQKLAIETTSNAENPMRFGRIPVLTCDVWEHAYYIDYRNDRARYLKTILPLLNWEFAEKNLAAIKNLSA
jgi:Fe-Mn family superoxide dismutase